MDSSRLQEYIIMLANGILVLICIYGVEKVSASEAVITNNTVLKFVLISILLTALAAIKQCRISLDIKDLQKE